MGGLIVCEVKQELRRKVETSENELRACASVKLSYTPYTRNSHGPALFQK